MISGRPLNKLQAEGGIVGFLLCPGFFQFQAVFHALLFCAGCVQLPDYALPQFGMNQGPQLAGITYRQLTRDDFQAASLPEGLQAHAVALSARSSLQIRPGRDVHITINSNWYHGQLVYFGRVENLRFEAVLIPEKSWWNPDIPKNREAYVLEHEQIHFGLLELAARKLTQEAAAAGSDILVIDTSYARVRDGVMQRIEELVQSRSEDLYNEHKLFDERTSLFYDPSGQRRWLERLEEQLGQ